MSLTPSTMLELGTQAPDFALPDTEGAIVKRSDFNDCKALVVMFICNHCPYVLHIRDELANLGRDYQQRGVGIVAISANDATKYPADSPQKMAEEKADADYTFPYLYDEKQAIAKAYQAACTPDFYVFDADHKLTYRGQLDDSRPGSDIPVTGADLRAAIDAAVAGSAPIENQMPSIGCNIKWIRGNEPVYFPAATPPREETDA